MSNLSLSGSLPRQTAVNSGSNSPRIAAATAAHSTPQQSASSLIGARGVSRQTLVAQDLLQPHTVAQLSEGLEQTSAATMQSQAKKIPGIRGLNQAQQAVSQTHQQANQLQLPALKLGQGEPYEVSTSSLTERFSAQSTSSSVKVALSDSDELLLKACQASSPQELHDALNSLRIRADICEHHGEKGFARAIIGEAVQAIRESRDQHPDWEIPQTQELHQFNQAAFKHGILEGGLKGGVDLPKLRDDAGQLYANMQAPIQALAQLNLPQNFAAQAPYQNLSAGIHNKLTRLRTLQQALTTTQTNLDRTLANDEQPSPGLIDQYMRQYTAQANDFKIELNRLKREIEGSFNNNKNELHGLDKDEHEALIKLYAFSQEGTREQALGKILQFGAQNDGFKNFVCEVMTHELKTAPNAANRLEQMANLLDPQDGKIATSRTQFFEGLNHYLSEHYENRLDGTIDQMLVKLRDQGVGQKLGAVAQQCQIRVALHPIEIAPNNDSIDTLSDDIKRLEGTYTKQKNNQYPFRPAGYVQITVNGFDQTIGNLTTRINALVTAQTSAENYKKIAHRLLYLPQQAPFTDVYENLAQKHAQLRSQKANDNFGTVYTSLTLDKEAKDALLANGSAICLTNVVFDDPDRQARNQSHAFRYTGAILGNESTRIAGREHNIGNQVMSLLLGHEQGNQHTTLTHIATANTVIQNYTNRYQNNQNANQKMTLSTVGQVIGGDIRHVQVNNPMMLLTQTDNWRNAD